MYTPRGFGVSELGDIEVVAAGEELHLFHLTLPNHDVVRHAISRDGLSWAPVPAALRTGDPGACDDDQIWTMSVTPRPGGDGYLMLYTALATGDHGRIQRVAMARSDDLLHWTKLPRAAVIAADPRWYEADPGASGFVSWRDPKPVHVGVGNSYLATICARENQGPLPRRGCVGLLVSDDLERWETRPPLFAPRRYWDLECPQVFRLGAQPDPARWYLTAAIMEDRSQRYWTAHEATGPYRVPPGGDLLAPAGHYAARVTRWRDMDLLFAWHQPRLNEGWMTSPRTIDWVDARNPFGKFLAPPLLLSARDDGRLALGSFPGWDAYRGGGWEVPPPRERTLFGERATSTESGWRIAADGAMDVLLAAVAATDFVVEGSLSLSGARGGLALRLDDDGCGLYVELSSDSRRIVLQRWGMTRNDRDGLPRYAHEELQSSDRSARVDVGHPVPFRLLSVGPYIEVSFGGDVAISAMTGNPASGGWGIWVEDGSCAAGDLRWAPMRRPASGGSSERRPSVEAARVG